MVAEWGSMPDRTGAPHRTAIEDDLRFCERCGISFVWTIEEEKQAERIGLPASNLCPGCRALLPAPGRERGQVKWYNVRKRYGFIVRNGRPDLFVPAAAIRDRRMLHPGDLVEFSLGENAGGPVAEAVSVIAPAAQEAPPQRGRPSPTGAPSTNSSTKAS